MTRKLGLVIALMLVMLVGTTAFAKTPAPGQNSNTSMAADNGNMKSGRRRHRRGRRHHRRGGRRGRSSKTTGNANKM
ncbi:MAG TPA: hypothetical protein VGC91_09985 [Pyrinomonadaceae bacterium]